MVNNRVYLAKTDDAMVGEGEQTTGNSSIYYELRLRHRGWLPLGEILQDMNDFEAEGPERETCDLYRKMDCSFYYIT